jgi:ABC-type transporter Mla subunit MlaD
VAKIPRLDTTLTGLVGTLVGAVQAQAAAATALPSAVQSLGTAVRTLADTAAGARDTVTRLNGLVTRLDGLVQELEEPLTELGPGLRTLAKVLQDPAVAAVPDTLAQVQRDILPVLRALADTNERVAVIAGSTERLMAFVDDTGRTLAGLPGAALLARRRAPAPAPVRPEIP